MATNPFTETTFEFYEETGQLSVVGTDYPAGTRHYIATFTWASPNPMPDGLSHNYSSGRIDLSTGAFFWEHSISSFGTFYFVPNGSEELPESLTIDWTGKTGFVGDWGSTTYTFREVVITPPSISSVEATLGFVQVSRDSAGRTRAIPAYRRGGPTLSWNNLLERTGTHVIEWADRETYEKHTLNIGWRDPDGRYVFTNTSDALPDDGVVRVRTL